VAVLFIDLDTFKTVNDTHGHDIGDELLGAVADRLADCVRAGDTLARLGGDEFVALLVDLSEDDHANSTAHRMLNLLAEPFMLGDLTLRISASIGVAVARAGRAKDLLHAADGAMYEAKNAGPGRVVTRSMSS
jgi:diguanylate cyclase (GGDEF)-like protein